jgi:predicted nucleic acid-binding protein
MAACQDGSIRHLISRLLPTEIASALAMGVRTGVSSTAERDALWQLFLSDLADQYMTVELAEPIWSHAHRLIFKYALRAADAIHVGTALMLTERSQWQDISFFTADERQARAARAEALAVQFI